MPDLSNTLRLQMEWEDPRAARGEELAATWCRLSIHVGSTPVTRVLDDRAQTVRDAVYCSAYPLAEWVAFNWWALLHEPDRASPAGKRHNLRFAREGFALPELELFPEGSLVHAVWRAHRPAAAPVRFLEEGFAFLDHTAVKEELRGFVEKVLARLNSQGLHRTPLAEEWTAIVNTTAAEREFCELAGALGLDPYDLEDRQGREVCSVADALPPELKREFFMAADAASITRQAGWVRKCLHGLEEYQTATSLAGKKGLYRASSRAASPWQTGYDLARRFRIEFKLGKTDRPARLERLCETRRGPLPVIRIGDERRLDGVAGLPQKYGPQVATAKHLDSSRAYLLARAMCEFLCSEAEGAALLTRIPSDQQKRNRAFAAELLAPAEGIRKLVSGSRVPRDEVAEIAHHFGVSEWLVAHQMQNHRIAHVDAAEPGLPWS